MKFTRGEFHRNDAAAGRAVHNQFHDLKFIEKVDVVFNTLLIKGLQNHMAGPVRGVTGPSNRRFAEILGMPSEPPLIDFSFPGPAEGKAPVFQVVNRLDRLFGQDHGRILVHEVVAAFDGVKGVPLGLVFLHVAKGGADAALGCSGMAADGMKLGQNGGVGTLARLQCGVQPRTAGSDDNRIVFVVQSNLPLLRGSDKVITDFRFRGETAEWPAFEQEHNVGEAGQQKNAGPAVKPCSKKDYPRKGTGLSIGDSPQNRYRAFKPGSESLILAENFLPQRRRS
jgi:hypothetical protein